MLGKTILLVAFVSQLAGAAESTNWHDCVDKASKNNSELQAAQATARAAQYTARAAYSGFFPTVTGSLTYSYGTGNPSSNTTGGSSFTSSTGETKNNYGATLSATQNLFSGLQDKGKVDQASALSKAQDSAVEIAKAKISSDLKTAYAGLLYSERLSKLDTQIVHRREDNLRLVELRFQIGRENKGSVLLSKAYLNQARYEDLQARNGIAVTSNQLSRVLGIDDDTEFVVNEDIPLVDPPATSDFTQLVHSTPDHRQSVAQEEAADAGIAIARSGFFPTLGINASFGRLGQEWFPQTERWSVGATLALPIFNGGKDYYGTKSASAAYVAATATRHNLDRQTLAKLRQTHAAYVEAREKLIVDESFREAASKRAEIARGKYNNGLMTFEDWDLIENDLIARERAVLQSQRDRVTAEAAWQQTLGKGVLP